MTTKFDPDAWLAGHMRLIVAYGNRTFACGAHDVAHGNYQELQDAATAAADRVKASANALLQQLAAARQEIARLPQLLDITAHHVSEGRYGWLDPYTRDALLAHWRAGKAPVPDVLRPADEQPNIDATALPPAAEAFMHAAPDPALVAPPFDSLEEAQMAAARQDSMLKINSGVEVEHAVADLAACVTCGAPVEVNAAQAGDMTPISSIRYWIDAYASPSSGTHFAGHGMVIKMLREYADLRERDTGTGAQRNSEALIAEHMRLVDAHVDDMVGFETMPGHFSMDAADRAEDRCAATKAAVEASARKLAGGAA